MFVLDKTSYSDNLMFLLYDCEKKKAKSRVFIFNLGMVEVISVYFKYLLSKSGSEPKMKNNKTSRSPCGPQLKRDENPIQ